MVAAREVFGNYDECAWDYTENKVRGSEGMRKGWMPARRQQEWWSTFQIPSKYTYRIGADGAGMGYWWQGKESGSVEVDVS